jgi:hypothetical protein
VFKSNVSSDEPEKYTALILSAFFLFVNSNLCHNVETSFRISSVTGSGNLPALRFFKGSEDAAKDAEDAAKDAEDDAKDAAKDAEDDAEDAAKDDEDEAEDAEDDAEDDDEDDDEDDEDEDDGDGVDVIIFSSFFFFFSRFSNSIRAHSF